MYPQQFILRPYWMHVCMPNARLYFENEYFRHVYNDPNFFVEF